MERVHDFAIRHFFFLDLLRWSTMSRRVESGSITPDLFAPAGAQGEIVRVPESPWRELSK